MANSSVAGAVGVVVLVLVSMCAAAPTDLVADVLVYDATSGGVTAAVAAARHGMKTILVCASWPACFPDGGLRVGGLSSGGLGQTDIGGHPDIIGGLAEEFYTRNRQHYGSIAPTPSSSLASASSSCRLPTAGCNQTYNLEPHVALGIFEALLRDAKVEVLYGAQVDKVAKSGQTITSITLTNGTAIKASVFIDASYEGDLLARAGVSYHVGREANTTYNESLAGNTGGRSGNQFTVVVDPYDKDGQPLPHFYTGDPGIPGEADKKVQSYNFRLCVTKNVSNQIAFPKPAGYDASEWELLRRYVAALGGQYRVPSPNTAPVPNSKYDMNNGGPVSSDFIGASWDYPEANYSYRQEIWRRHRDYQQGLLWTLTNDPGIPEHVRDEAKAWGLCKDEFPATNGFAAALYVRAARRLVGDNVFTQNSPKTKPPANQVIGLGNYNMDSHNAQRIACRSRDACWGRGPHGASGAFAWDEGDVQVNPGIYQIPYWVMLPKETETSNLLVVAAPSASHIGMATLRMEPQFMIVGHSAGVAASLAVQERVAVSKLDFDTFSAKLRADKQKLDLPLPAVSYACLASRCIQKPSKTPESNHTCVVDHCGPLEANEWLANNEFWVFGSSNITANGDTFLKKSEVFSSLLPPSMIKSVAKGTVLPIAHGSTPVDNGYTLVALA
eukprot:m.79717 g.79717  ORF g.79717 m.79717 type:complete len:670 (+) comp14635_c0_seq1:59-2068(+)